MWVFKGGVYSSLALFDNVSIHALRQLQSALMLRENAEKEKKKKNTKKIKAKVPTSTKASVRSLARSMTGKWRPATILAFSFPGMTVG